MNLGDLELKHILKSKDFIESLQQEFKQEEIIEIQNFIQENNEMYSEVIDTFFEWLDNEFESSGTNVLSIGWDSSGWGPGGNGSIQFTERFGIVTMNSSDYEDDHVEIFDKQEFYPWCIQSLENDYIYLDSDIYNETELIELANNMGLRENTQLTVNGNEI
jgi:hypothetical protein